MKNIGFQRVVWAVSVGCVGGFSGLCGWLVRGCVGWVGGFSGLGGRFWGCRAGWWGVGDLSRGVLVDGGNFAEQN